MGQSAPKSSRPAASGMSGMVVAARRRGGAARGHGFCSRTSGFFSLGTHSGFNSISIRRTLASSTNGRECALDNAPQSSCAQNASARATPRGLFAPRPLQQFEPAIEGRFAQFGTQARAHLMPCPLSASGLVFLSSWPISPDDSPISEDTENLFLSFSVSPFASAIIRIPSRAHANQDASIILPGP